MKLGRKYGWKSRYLKKPNFNDNVASDKFHRQFDENTIVNTLTSETKQYDENVTQSLWVLYMYII